MKRIHKEILNLAIPNIVSNISVPLLSTVDTILMGRMSAAHLGAVGIGSMIFNFIYWNFGFLRMGTTGMTAQAYGRNDDRRIAMHLGRSAFLSVIIAVLILLLQVPLYQSSAFLLNISSEIDPLVSEYFYTRMWAAPATLALYALLGWFFGMQNAMIPLVLTIVINITNILVSAFLVREMGLGIKGVAMGTVIAQYIGVVLAMVFIFRKYYIHLSKIRMKELLVWSELKQFLQINSDLFIRTVLLTFAFGFFYSKSSAEGEIILAVNVVLLQYLNWMSYGIDGFAYAAESVVGKYAGKDDIKLLHRAIVQSFQWGLGFAILYAVMYGAMGDYLLYIFTDEQNVIASAREFLPWMLIFPILSFSSYLWDGVFIGLTAGKAMRNSMSLSFVIFIASYYLLAPQYGNHGLWAAMLILMVTRGVIQTWMYHRAGNELR